MSASFISERDGLADEDPRPPACDDVCSNLIETASLAPREMACGDVHAAPATSSHARHASLDQLLLDCRGGPAPAHQSRPPQHRALLDLARLDRFVLQKSKSAIDLCERQHEPHCESPALSPPFAPGSHRLESSTLWTQVAQVAHLTLATASMAAMSLASSHHRIPNPAVIARWQSAFKKICYMLAFSHALHTLRDMTGATLIRPYQLRLIRPLGAGAYAEVKLCRFTRKLRSRLVAVKVLKPNVVTNSHDKDSFQQEVMLLRKLRCSHIVEFIGMGFLDSERKSMFLVQEYMNRDSLRTLIWRQMHTSSRLFSHSDALRWAIQMARGLAYLHDAKPMVIHRDIKLENILLSRPGRGERIEAKLADFGLVALIRWSQEALQRASINQAPQPSPMPWLWRPSMELMAKMSTPEGMQAMWDQRTTGKAKSYAAKSIQGTTLMYKLSGMTGTLMYMAPEVFKELPYNHKVDVFSFGVVLFELFSRYLMLAAISLQGTPKEQELYAERVSKGYRPPFQAQVPLPLQELIQRCWHQTPEQRPHMAEVVQRLLQIQDDGVALEWDVADPPPHHDCSSCTVC